MSETKVSHCGRGEDAIYFATAKNRYVGSVSLGYGPTGSESGGKSSAERSRKSGRSSRRCIRN
jgi:hypothetical protein